MQSQSQLNAQADITALDIKVAILKSYVAWFANLNTPSDDECMQAFDYIEGGDIGLGVELRLALHMGFIIILKIQRKSLTQHRFAGLMDRRCQKPIQVPH